MKATELIRELQGLVEAHGDGLVIELEKVKMTCSCFGPEGLFKPHGAATLVCTCVEQPKDPCAAHGPKIF